MNRAMALPEKIALTERARTQGCTLDGAPAVVSGYGLPFAHVRRKDGKGGDVEFAWPTVERILTMRDGRFQS